MNFLIDVHWVFKTRQAGSERYTAHVHKYLVQKGHRVKYLVAKDIGELEGSNFFTWEGAEVHVDTGDLNLVDSLYEWADVVWSHLNHTRRSIDYSRKHRKPLVNVQHNIDQFNYYRVKPHEVELVLYNTEWIRQKTEKCFKSKQNHVLVPPFSRAEFECSDDQKEFITHINTNEGKGILYSRHYAKELPEYKFLFQMGSYFVQWVPAGRAEEFKHLKIGMKEVQYPPNVTYQGLTSNMLDDVYRKTKILVCPSVIDTWGMMVAEAMASGIPVICHPDPGFLECGGKAGIFIDRKNSKAVCDMITKLMENEDFYAQKSQQSRDRAREIEELGQQQLDSLYEKLLKLRFE